MTETHPFAVKRMELIEEGNVNVANKDWARTDSCGRGIFGQSVLGLT
jgi:hypothetical protein